MLFSGGLGGVPIGDVGHEKGRDVFFADTGVVAFASGRNCYSIWLYRMVSIE